MAMANSENIRGQYYDRACGGGTNTMSEHGDDDERYSSHNHRRHRNSMPECCHNNTSSRCGFCRRPSTSPVVIISPWIRKPLWIVLDEERQRELQDTTVTLRRHLTLFDLVAVGVGGTIGSGIFVLAGYIAHHYAGPATILSFAVAGVAACCSGLCFAELSGRIPAAGSTYIYAYVCLGELPAVLAAACLTLEYGVASAAVARSWGDKVTTWLVEQWHWKEAGQYLQLGYGINVMAFLISSMTVALLLYGVQESKKATNFFAALKVALVLFMTIGGFCLFDSTNLRPFSPMGATGVLRGATSSFFGYLGYDEVCCISGEAIHPHRDMPRAVLWTLAIVTILYMFAALALTGMQPSTSIDDQSGFPAGFSYNGVTWAAQISAFGEVLTLPVVVLIGLMAQPRLFLALARDGLMPESLLLLFARVDDRGNLYSGALLSGVVMTIVATFVPFSFLNDLISSGILVAFCMTNSCLILMRHESPEQQPQLLNQSLSAYNFLCLTSGMIMSHAPHHGALISIPCLLLTAAMPLLIYMKCPKSKTFGTGGSLLHRRNSNDMDSTCATNSSNRNNTTMNDNSSGNSSGNSSSNDDDNSHDNPNSSAAANHHPYFQTPCVPFLPCLGIFVNWYLVSRLELYGLAMLLLYLGLVTACYFACCIHSSVGNTTGWRRGGGIYQTVAPSADDIPSSPPPPQQHDRVMLRTIISLPNLQRNEITTSTSVNAGAVEDDDDDRDLNLPIIT